MMTNVFTTGVIVSGLLSIGNVAAASDWPTGRFEFEIEHETYGDIGTHTVSLEQNGEELVVEVHNRVHIQVLFWTYRSEANHKEVWRDGRLIAYDSFADGDDHGDGKPITVTAHTHGDKLIVLGPSGHVEAPGSILSSHPWNPKIVEQDLLMHSKTGELKKVKVVARGEEWVNTDRRRVKARKYQMSGDIEREIWYDANGVCVRMRFMKNGKEVTFTRRQPYHPATPTPEAESLQ